MIIVEGMTRPDMIEEVDSIENKIRRRLPRGSRIATARLTDYFLEQGHNNYAVEKAINIMLRFFPFFLPFLPFLSSIFFLPFLFFSSLSSFFKKKEKLNCKSIHRKDELKHQNGRMYLVRAR
jgi:hypothetical protein